MKTVIVYCVPMDSPEVWALFKPFVERFCHSMRNTEPGCEYTVAAILNSKAYPIHTVDGTTELISMFSGIPTEFYSYTGSGCDVGSYQFFAERTTENVFQVNCSSRVYAWKAGWLKRLVEAREMLGPGLFATSVSKESGRLHVCLRCFGVDSDDFKKYPTKIVSRDQSGWFECGDGNLMEWYQSQGLKTTAVYWDGFCDISEEGFSKCSTENIYRRGNQSQILVKDKHSLAYDEASPEEKLRLERMCFEGVQA